MRYSNPYPTSSLFLVFLLFVSFNSNGAFAVDRSKFRTCKDTSFCRRYRDNEAYENLYDYRLLKDSIEFNMPTIIQEDAEGSAAAAASTNEDSSSLWKSFQKRFLGDSTDGGGETNGDSGSTIHPLTKIKPTLSGVLLNKAQETSSGTKDEKLLWSIYAMNDGMVRMRITEMHGIAGSPYEHSRVTYDHLVLENDSMSYPADHARWIRPSASGTERDANENAADDVLIQQIIPQLLSSTPSHSNPYTANDNYMGLEYGTEDDSQNTNMILMIRLDPFAVYLFRKDEISNNSGPILVVGDRGKMHFEIRRNKQVPNNDESTGENGATEEKKQESEETNNKNAEEKEIVGYWEDGLAIYADGTREEKVDASATEEHRKLLEKNMHELDTDGLWEEKFQSHHDSKPYGPMSVGIDMTFPNSRHLFGLPEHASSTLLQTTIGVDSYYKEPYRLYNLDVFEYELDETMALYGHVPLVVSQSVVSGTTGIFYFNPTETFVDVTTTTAATTSTSTHFISESGILDMFLLPGPTPQKFYKQYAQLTGYMPLPPMFSLGYQQCRWNYKDEADVYFVHNKFEEYDYPYDVLWLDIEHTDGKRYFTWDNNLFPNPIEMQQRLASDGRKMVTIIDPHIKRDDNYYIHKKASNKGLYIKDKDGSKDYDGWCWPGSSSYLDFTNQQVRTWWANQFNYDKYIGSTSSLYTWNDMNEPSVFNGPEVSMQKDLKNLNGEEHREWHNLYGMLFQRATMEGLIKRNLYSTSPPISINLQYNKGAAGAIDVSSDENNNKKLLQRLRPFVLSRAFFAGSQKYGAIWTGDNLADWGHLVVSSPMLLSLNVAALSFVGADVGGFFGNPDWELFVRWMQAGAYQPFFRGHAHHDSKRREPWTYDEDGSTTVLSKLRKSAMTRYALLPYWYTVFQEAGITGMPVMRTMWMQYPRTESLFATDDQYMIGSDLLVKPVTAPGVTESEVKFPTDHLWYDVESLIQVPIEAQTSSQVQAIVVPSDIDTIPAFQRGGSIIPRKLRLRRSSQLMKTDPYTLYIALDHEKQAAGRLYMDDEETFEYTKGYNAEAKFTADLSTGEASIGIIGNSVSMGAGWSDQKYNAINSSERMIERIIVMGVQTKPKDIHVLEDGDNHDEEDEEQDETNKSSKRSLDFIYTESSQVLVVRKPDVSAVRDWEIMIHF